MDDLTVAMLLVCGFALGLVAGFKAGHAIAGRDTAEALARMLARRPDADQLMEKYIGMPPHKKAK